MTFSTILAKYPGTCRRCGDPITPGERIRWAGRGRTYHMAAACQQTEHTAPRDLAPRAYDLDRERIAERAAERAAEDAATGFTFERVGYDR